MAEKITREIFNSATIENKKEYLKRKMADISRALGSSLDPQEPGFSLIGFLARQDSEKGIAKSEDAFGNYYEQCQRLVENLTNDKIDLMTESELETIGFDVFNVSDWAQIIYDQYKEKVEPDLDIVTNTARRNQILGSFIDLGERVDHAVAWCQSKESVKTETVTESTETTSERVEEAVSEDTIPVTDDTTVAEDSATVGITPEAETSTEPRKTWGDRARQFFDRFRRTPTETTVEAESANAEVVHDESDMGFAEADVEEVTVGDYVEPIVEETVTETEETSEAVSGENIPTVSRELNKEQAKIVQTAIRYSAGHVEIHLSKWVVKHFSILIENLLDFQKQLVERLKILLL